ncbi:glutathione S-transferase [Rickettsiales bacterium]|nr:glutathione S-transferase [Rickettsiales bacterium]
MNNLPILYSFRRCPYAMRARMAIIYSGLKCILREVDLKNKPEQLMEISPKATVPVLCMPDGRLIDESLDIIKYAISQNDPDGWGDFGGEYENIVKVNDMDFVPFLRKYKYFERYKENSQEYYRKQCEEIFLKKIEKKLSENSYLLGNKLTAADIAIMPFIRQFAGVDNLWFESCEYKNTRKWLTNLVKSNLFEKIMIKNKPWKEGDKPVLFA